MYPSQSQANAATQNGQQQQQPHQPHQNQPQQQQYSSNVGQSAMNNYANQQQLFAQQQQQQNQWHFSGQHHQQVQMANSIGNSGPLKRQLNGIEESEEKENSGPNKRPRGGQQQELHGQKPILDEVDAGQRGRTATAEEEEAEDEVDEEEEEGDTSGSTKTDGSSPEHSSPQQSVSITNSGNGSQLQLQQSQPAQGTLQQQHPMLAQYLGYSTPQQQQTTAVQKNYAASIAAANGTAAANGNGNHLAQFGMMPTTPLAHSTPMLGANAAAAYSSYANATNAAAYTIRNLQNLQQLCVAPGAAGMIGNGLSPFSHYMGGGPYGIVAPSPTMHTQQQHQQQQNALALARGHSSNAGQLQQQQQQQAAYANTAHSQQQLMNAYGISPSIGWNASSGQPAFMTDRSSTATVGMFHQSASQPPSLNSTLGSSIGHGHGDSGLGIGAEHGGGGEQPQNKNESSSGGSSEESSLGAPNLSNDIVAANELVFPPYIRSALINGIRELIDLERILFDKPVPARLSLLNKNTKYAVTLAELHRRLSPPECLNTSYLSVILRRAKNKHGGSHLREILAGYGCGLEMQTGKRKSIQVTTFSALCERESINMVEDLEKIIKDSMNGFPHVKVAEEMERRDLRQHNAKSPEQQEKRLLDIRSTMEILRDAIGIVQMGIEKETQQFATVAEKMPAEPKDDELMPQTLDRFKRFARLSHCFGNRAVLVSWQALLEVLGQLEGIQTGGYLQSVGLGGVVSTFGPPTGSGNDNFLAGTSAQSNEQANANLLMHKLFKAERQ